MICKLQRVVVYLPSVWTLDEVIIGEMKNWWEKSGRGREHRVVWFKKEKCDFDGPETWAYQNIISPSRKANQRENENNCYWRKCHHHDILLVFIPHFFMSQPNQTMLDILYPIHRRRKLLIIWYANCGKAGNWQLQHTLLHRIRNSKLKLITTIYLLGTN